MAQLPFLVVHGGLVWKLLLVVLIAATYAVSYAIRQLARQDIAPQLREVSNPKSGATTIRGRIKNGTAVTARQPEASFDAPPGKLTLEYDGQIVDVVGTVRVEHGSTSRGSLRGPNGVVANLPRGYPTLVRSVGVGSVRAADARFVAANHEPSRRSARRIAHVSG